MLSNMVVLNCSHYFIFQHLIRRRLLGLHHVIGGFAVLFKQRGQRVQMFTVFEFVPFQFAVIRRSNVNVSAERSF